ncbi:hypothetical protein [Stenotrophomonas phage CM2]
MKQPAQANTSTCTGWPRKEVIEGWVYRRHDDGSQGDELRFKYAGIHQAFNPGVYLPPRMVST